MSVLVILGGTSGLGKVFTEEALSFGHSVVMHSQIQQENDNFKLKGATVVAAEVLNKDVLLSIFGHTEGEDVIVVSFLSEKSFSEFKIGFDEINDVVEVSESVKVQRFLLISTFASPEYESIYNAEEITNIENCLSNSTLNWTIVKSGELADKEATSVVKFESNNSNSKEISRQALADALLDIMFDPAYFHQVKFVSN
jgi:putative NADH-flavin reductase